MEINVEMPIDKTRIVYSLRLTQPTHLCDRKDLDMSTWVLLFSFVEVMSLPIVGSVALGLSKLTSGPAARVAEHWFLGVLLAVTLITCRTVIMLDACWLVHTSTLGFMIVGALLLPDRESLDQRRFVGNWR